MAQLFPRLPSGAFVEKYFPDRPLAVHGPLARFATLASDQRLVDPCALIQAGAHDTVIVYLTTPDGQRHQGRVTKPTALELYDHGSTVDAAAVNTTLPVLGDFTRALRTELGLHFVKELALRASQIMCDAIISPPGNAVPKHFDSVETLSLQLVGRKVWKYAPPAVPYPHHPYFPTLFNRRDGQEYPSYYPKSFSKTMPKGSKTVVMKPGSVLFLPRGYWHETRALEHSISLSFVFNTATWGGFVGTVVDALLIDDPHWRTPVPYATPAQKLAAHAHLADELRRLGKQLVERAGAAMRDSQETAYVTATGVKVHFVRNAGKKPGHSSWRITIGSRENGGVELEADEDVTEAIRAVSSRQTSFTARQLAAEFQLPDGDKLVSILSEAGLVRPM